MAYLIVLYWVLVAMMFIGAIGEFIPAFPGITLILVSILTWCIATGFTGIGWPIAAVFVVLILSAAVETLSIYWGAKRMGASGWGQLGAFVGALLGVFGLLPALPVGGPIVGLLVGPILGAFVAEFLYRFKEPLGSRMKIALKASLGIIFGTILGNILDGILAIAAVIIFVISTYPPLGL